MSAPVLFITGAAKRIGAEISQHLHGLGYRLVLHYHHSKACAEDLAAGLNEIRPGSVALVQQDLTQLEALPSLADKVLSQYGRLDGLINNASSFYATPFGQGTPGQWHDLMATNAAAPYFLAQALAPALQDSRGSIINMVDIHAEKGLKDHLIYTMAKGALITMTRGLASELAPGVRVNGIAPGVILWPEHPLSDIQKQQVLGSIPMGRAGSPQDIAETMAFLLTGPAYLTGQIIAIDGGRSTKGLNNV